MDRFPLECDPETYDTVAQRTSWRTASTGSAADLPHPECGFTPGICCLMDREEMNRTEGAHGPSVGVPSMTDGHTVGVVRRSDGFEKEEVRMNSSSSVRASNCITAGALC